ncbi:hypothetical protein [Streptomyces sp. NBC_00347]|uniref:hypothetical protein n=1 Tax=Streptomyces sp. NBC_00347 TaxID=2975721 RepID=UPI00225840A6|nr:hypothetical protein [Streptomyces sp. NBC_00347]
MLVRRTVLTASAVSLALFTSGCGGSGSVAEKADPKPSASASAPTPAVPAAKGKTDAELAGMILVQADLPDHLFKAVSEKDVEAGKHAVSDVPDCLPVLQAMAAAPIGSPTGAARITVAAKPKPVAKDASEEDKQLAARNALGTTATVVSLYSYDGDGAQRAFRSLFDAGLPCEKGFVPTVAGEELGDTTVRPFTKVEVGDENLTYTLAMADEEIGRISTELVVVRKANTLAVFHAQSMSGTADHPKSVVEAQAGKLG